MARHACGDRIPIERPHGLKNAPAAPSPRRSSALSSMTSLRATPAASAAWRLRRVSSRAISFGRNTKPTHPVSMALMGMPGKRADPGYCAKVVPPACLIARMPRAPSEPPPERTTPIALSPCSSVARYREFGPCANAPTTLNRVTVPCFPSERPSERAYVHDWGRTTDGSLT